MTAENPYVGPRPFEREDAGRFFGRERDTRDLASMIIAHRVVLLYSASGAGKSSLLNAGVLPLLERKGFDVLPVARVGLLAVEPPANVFAGTLAVELGGGDGSIAAALHARERRLDEEGEPVPRALVIDQFEELFTAHPEHWSYRSGLFEELRDALEADGQLRLLFILREEYLAQLEPYSPQLPGGLKMRFRLERLDRDAALEAVTRPLEGTGRSFAPGVAGNLVDDLLTLRVDTGSGESIEVPGEFVEPVHLQVICSRLWAELPSDVTEIGPEDIQAFADLDTVLGRFYDDALAAAQSQAGVSDRRLRRWVRDELITPGGTRSTVYRGRDETAGLPNRAVEALEDKRLVRAEQRAGALWYELTHDRLIAPIRASERRVAARARRRRNLALIGLVAAAVAMAAAFGVVLGWFTEPPGNRNIPPQTEVTGEEALGLARLFAPVLRYDSKELFVPISRTAYISRTQLKEQEGRFVRVIKNEVNEELLPASLGACLKGCLLFLDVRGAEPDPPKHVEKQYDAIENELIDSGARPTVYYHVAHYDDTNEYAVQYWFLYFFNYRLNEHESDWEQITVHLDEDRQPTDVYYSAHEGGNTRAFAQIAEGERPVVYPALGSHANYFHPGLHSVEIGCERVTGSISACLRGRKLLIDVNDAKGAELTLGGYDLAEFKGPVYVGSYGSGNYVVLTRKPSVLLDPRARGAWLDPLRFLLSPATPSTGMVTPREGGG